MLKDKKALITGASRGIGRAIALDMAAHGADIAFIYAGNVAAAEETCRLIEEEGARAFPFQCDVTDDQAVRETVKKAVLALGGLDILVNNSGIVKDGLIPLMKEDRFTSVIDTNLSGAYRMIRYSCMTMMKQGNGRIINISSVVGISGNAGQSNYAASKAGLIGLTKSVAKELGARGITCNAIAPGYIKTDMTDALPEDTRRALLSQLPLGRMGEPEDVAHLASFLASDLAGYITGGVFTVDGGMCV